MKRGHQRVVYRQNGNGGAREHVRCTAHTVYFCVLGGMVFMCGVGINGEAGNHAVIIMMVCIHHT